MTVRGIVESVAFIPNKTREWEARLAPAKLKGGVEEM
jgi:hypothetical protein